MSTEKKPWSGRFSASTDELMEQFNASIGFDRKLLELDVAGSVAYARALHKAGVLTAEEVERLVQGLQQAKEDLLSDKTHLRPALEDIHMAVEQRLTDLVGPLGGKLHTGRSRNDQISLDERLYMRQSVGSLADRIRELQSVLLNSAESYRNVVLPGYTHLQQAQPILLSHYTLSLFWMLERDRGRLENAQERADVLPLGSGALAGSTYAVDREFLARELGFSAISENSIDAVSDRDFLIEFLAAVSILMMHLSRFCEDLIIWSSREFGFVVLDDAFATGSSMMPQKKNPDSLELIRGKCGRVYGDLMSLLTTMKGVPLTYAKDMQEDKEPVFDAAETAEVCLRVFARVWETMSIHPDRMRAAIDDQVLSTDLADYLVKQGVSFRESHHLVGVLVRQTEQDGGKLASLRLEDLQRHSEKFQKDVLELLSPESSLCARNIPGGTGNRAVEEQIKKARAALSR